MSETLISSRAKRDFEVKQKTFLLVSQVLSFKLKKETSKNQGAIIRWDNCLDTINCELEA